METNPRHPLAHGNRLQRAYARWAEPQYAQMPPALRLRAQEVDGWLCSRRAAGLWAGLACAIAAMSAGLWHARLPLWLALLCSLVTWLGLLAGLLGIWRRPDLHGPRRFIRDALLSTTLAYLGVSAGFAIGRLQQPDAWRLSTFTGALRDAVIVSTPFVVLLLLAVMGLSWAVKQVRRQHHERELRSLRLLRERDHAARQAAEAQLRLLQAQIQPHFIFNTLATVQHWVDTADARAAPLLRALTTFLRGSTELLAREQATLGEEAALARHYLAIQQARLGQRLQVVIDIDPAVAGQVLPPGLLLTLVENAVEHGISPALAGGTVQVQAGTTAAGWQLSVSDDGAGLAAAWQDGTGLANCRQRLAHQFGPRARLAVTPAQPGTLAHIAIDTQPDAKDAP